MANSVTTSISQSYQQAIANALDLEDGNAAVDSVKEVVVRQLNSLDRRAEITSTRFFNHSFAPDFVLSWPRDEGGDRYVYLRLTDSLDFLREGIGRIERSDSIVYNLQPPSAAEVDRHPALTDALAGTPTLLTDPAAVGTFIDRQRAEPVLSLVSNAISHGGRGFIDSRAAEATATSLASGFAAARRLETDATAAATATLGAVLDDRQSRRMGNLLQAIWIGSGGRLDAYPSPTDVTADLGDDVLAFLLNFDEINDPVFWNRLGQRADVTQLGRLRIDQPSANLQHLVRANLDHLWARAVSVRPTEPMLFEDGEKFAWVVERELLGLQGPDFVAYFAEKADDSRKGMKKASGRGVEIPELKRRSVNVVLSSLRISDGNERLEYSSETDEDIAQGEGLERYASPMGEMARIEYGQLVLPTSQHLALDFVDLTASAISSTRVSLLDLALLAIPVIWPFDGELSEALTEKFQVPGEVSADLLSLAEAEEVEHPELQPAEGPEAPRLRNLPDDARLRLLEALKHRPLLPPGGGSDEPS